MIHKSELEHLPFNSFLHPDGHIYTVKMRSLIKFREEAMKKMDYINKKKHSPKLSIRGFRCFCCDLSSNSLKYNTPNKGERRTVIATYGSAGHNCVTSKRTCCLCDIYKLSTGNNHPVYKRLRLGPLRTFLWFYRKGKSLMNPDNDNLIPLGSN